MIDHALWRTDWMRITFTPREKAFFQPWINPRDDEKEEKCVGYGDQRKRDRGSVSRVIIVWLDSRRRLSCEKIVGWRHGWKHWLSRVFIDYRFVTRWRELSGRWIEKGKSKEPRKTSFWIARNRCCAPEPTISTLRVMMDHWLIDKK